MYLYVSIFKYYFIKYNHKKYIYTEINLNLKYLKKYC